MTIANVILIAFVNSNDSYRCYYCYYCYYVLGLVDYKSYEKGYIHFFPLDFLKRIGLHSSKAFRFYA